MTATAPPSPTPTARRPHTRSGTALGALLLRLHFYAGLLVAPFLLVAALNRNLWPVGRDSVAASGRAPKIPVSPAPTGS